MWENRVGKQCAQKKVEFPGLVVNALLTDGTYTPAALSKHYSPLWHASPVMLEHLAVLTLTRLQRKRKRNKVSMGVLSVGRSQ